jgi:hypothetical protein
MRVVFVVALAVLIGAQLALMSILDVDRAEEAARSVAESEFAADLVGDVVLDAVAPLAGQELGTQLAQQASDDPRVATVLRRGLLDAHRAIVEPDAVVSTGSPEVQQVLDQVLAEAEAQAGVDLDGLQQRLDVPEIDPRYVPDAGAKPIAENVRDVAALVALVAAAVVLVVNPRRGRALAGLGFRAAIVCGAWGVALLLIGWVIGSTADTLYGELVAALWDASWPSMLLLVGAGVVLGVGFGVGGLSIDALTRPEPRATW